MVVFIYSFEELCLDDVYKYCAACSHVTLVEKYLNQVSRNEISWKLTYEKIEISVMQWHNTILIISPLSLHQQIERIKLKKLQNEYIWLSEVPARNKQYWKFHRNN